MRAAYINEIVSWNKKFNLTGLKEKQDIERKLYDDSQNIAKATDLTKKIKMIDIGCGAGFPGIPLKIEYPQIELTLIDSINKKIDFVQHVIKTLSLSGTEAVCSRAEDLGQNPKYREQFDIAVSRAVAKLNVLCEYCLPFVGVGGLFIAQKGPDIEDEINSAGNAIRSLGGKIQRRIQVDSGYVLVIEKTSRTPDDYPRRAGIPSKKPI